MQALRIAVSFFIFCGLLIASCSAARPHHQKGVRGAQKTFCYEKNKHSKISDKSHPVIVLDAGHGGSDEGAKVHGLLEKKLALSTTFLTKKALEELGYKVFLTRAKDAYVSLPKRADVANNLDSVLFLSIHYNSSKNAAAQGIEIFYFDSSEVWRNKASRRLANLVLHQLLDHTGAQSRGIKKGNFCVIRETNMPAILIEAGFMTSPEERLNLRDKTYLEKIAQGIAKGVDKYLKS